MTTVASLPVPPSRLDPANFRQRADDFLAALPALAAQINAVAAEINTDKSTVVSRVDLAMLSGLGTAAANAATALAKAAEAATAAAAASADRQLAQAAWTAAVAANPAVDSPVRMNPGVVRVDLAIPPGYRAYAAGPLEIAEGVVVDVADHGVLTII